MRFKEITKNKNLETWLKNSVVKHVVYHGTPNTVEMFNNNKIIWASEGTELPSEYALRYTGTSVDTQPNIIPLYMNIQRPFNADLNLSKTVTVGEFFNSVLEQAYTLTPAKEKLIKKFIDRVHKGRYEEESGPHYARHDFWHRTYSMFGVDGAKAIKKIFEILGFDGIVMQEMGEQTYGAFHPSQVKYAFNNINEEFGVPTLGILDIAQLHNVPPKVIIDQLKKGIEVEKEHTHDLIIAQEIALDHLTELPDYYTRLEKMEQA